MKHEDVSARQGCPQVKAIHLCLNVEFACVQGTASEVSLQLHLACASWRQSVMRAQVLGELLQPHDRQITLKNSQRHSHEEPFIQDVIPKKPHT